MIKKIYSDNEKKIITKMIRMYCRKKHCSENICSECSSVLEYSIKRIENCSWTGNKPNCSDCRTKCFSEEMQACLREIMKFSGPRMLYHDPAALLRWGYKKIKYKKRKNNLI